MVDHWSTISVFGSNHGILPRLSARGWPSSTRCLRGWPSSAGFLVVNQTTWLVAMRGDSPQLGSSFWSCTLISLRFSQRVARVRLNTEFVPLLFFPCCGQKHFDFSKKVETFLLSQFFGKGPPGAMPVGLFVIPWPILMGTGDDSVPTTVPRV